MSYQADNLERARQAKKSARSKAYRIVDHFHDHRQSLRDELDNVQTQLAQAENTIVELQAQTIKHNTIEWTCQTLILQVQQQIALARSKLCFLTQFTFSDITLHLFLLHWRI